MAKKNVWDKIKFDSEGESTIPKIINEQLEQLADNADGLLFAKLEALDTYLTIDKPELGVVYNANLFAPYLGNIRLQLFTVIEIADIVYFVDRINNTEKEQIQETDLIPRIEKFVENEVVSTFLKNFYDKSKEVRRSQL